MGQLGGLLDQVNKEWKKIDNHVIGHILHSPPISLGVSEQHFMEDWGVLDMGIDKLYQAQIFLTQAERIPEMSRLLLFCGQCSIIKTNC